MSQPQKDKDIKYQKMFLNSSTSKSIKPSIKDFDEIVSLQNNKDISNKPWSKLDKLTKIQKLQEYISDYASTHNLTKEKEITLQKYIRQCLDRKKLQRVKDVLYDKDKCIIKSIPGLSYNNTTSKFTLRVKDRSDNTLKNLTKVVRRKSKPSKLNKKKTKKIINVKKEEKNVENEVVVEGYT